MRGFIIIIIIYSILQKYSIAIDFINFPEIDYSVKNVFDTSKILLKYNNNEIKQVNCLNCIITNNSIDCIKDELIKVEIELKKNNLIIPFNISCENPQISKNIHIVEGIETKIGITNISLSWISPSIEIQYYIIYCITNNGNYTKQIINNNYNNNNQIFYFINNLQEKSWYQICIATIDKIYRTSKYKCIKELTDFSITGPITNINYSSTNYSIFIKWSPPQYQQDIPQGYIVHLYGDTNKCRIFIIEMMNIDIPSNNTCTNKQIINDPRSQIIIDQLSSYSKYDIIITPFNRNKQFINKYLSIQTKEGESDPVNDLKVIMNDQNWLTIQFNNPKIIRGKIIKYKLKIINTKINICTKNDIVVHEEYFDKTDHYISRENLRKCGSYLIEIFVVNGYEHNKGEGKPATIIFDQPNDNQQTLTTDVKFISSNSQIIIIKNIINNEQCKKFGFLIEINNENNDNNCLIKIISNIDCLELRNLINEISNCKNIEIIKFNNKSENIEIFVSGIFQYQQKYQTKVSIINNKIHNIISSNMVAGNIEDCFTDCYNKNGFYNGIRSVDIYGQICEQWKYSNNYKHYKNTKSNICISTKSSQPWCSTINNNWANCNVPNCYNINIGSGCVEIKTKESTNETIKINWSAPSYAITIIGYIILLHNDNNLCEQSNIMFCDNCDPKLSLDKTITNLYLPCQLKKKYKYIPDQEETYFNNLHQNMEYIIYIIPIINTQNIGEIKNITIRTLLAKPEAPKNFIIISQLIDQIKLSWEKPISSRKYGAANHYLLLYKKSISTEIKQEILSKESTILNNLEMCSEYCFNLFSINKAGNSESSNKLCTFTLAPKLSKVVLEDIKSEYKLYRNIKWQYQTINNCSKIYRLQYSIKNTNIYINKTTNNNSLSIRDLKKNVIYNVKVRAESLIKTINNNNIGEYSQIKEFYTGITKPKIFNYTELLYNSNSKLNISWKIDEDIQESIYEYIIQVTNQLQICTYLIHLTCISCEYQFIEQYLSVEQLENRNKLLNCSHIINETFIFDQTKFNYIIKKMEKLSNFSLVIYGTNLLGVHQLYKKDTIVAKNESKIMTTFFIIFLILIFVFFIMLIIIKKKKNPKILYDFIFRRNIVKKRNQVQRNKSIIVERKSEKPSQMESNGAISRRKSSRNTVDLDQLPKIKPKTGIKKNIHIVTIPAFAAYYQKMSMNNNSEIIQEYKKLTSEAKVVETTYKLTMEAGKHESNGKKNRFINILPFDQNRVKVGEKVFPNDYINASYIPFTNDDQNIEYIASQGPIDGSISDFWQMIWEQNINFIVMLTRTIEGEKFKCLQYWPNEVDEKEYYGNKNSFNVTLVEEVDKESHFERKLNVENIDTEECREILQLHMHTWFDHSAPNLNYFDKLLFRFHELVNMGASHPYLIHCSAGVGRTGTLICIDRIIKELINGCQEINIYDTVLNLRHYRNFMVQRQAQYIFIHDYINHFLSKYMKSGELEEQLYCNEEQQTDFS